MADDYTQSLREKFDLLIVERSRLQLDVEILTEENKKLREKVEHFRKLEAEAASHVEAIICARTNFTGEEPYIGWKGLGLALREALDERDRLREEVESLRTVVAGVKPPIRLREGRMADAEKLLGEQDPQGSGR